MNDSLKQKVTDSWNLNSQLYEKASNINDETSNNISGELVVKLVEMGYNLHQMQQENKIDNITSNNVPNLKNEILGDREEAVTKVDDNDLLLKFVEKVEQNNQQLKNDFIESEKRITEDRRESERRISEDRKLSEERMEKRYYDAIESSKQSEARIEKKFNETMNAIKEQNGKIDQLKGEIDSKIVGIQNKIDGTNKWIVGICITTILAIAGLVGTVVFSVFSIMAKR